MSLRRNSNPTSSIASTHAAVASSRLRNALIIAPTSSMAPVHPANAAPAATTNNAATRHETPAAALSTKLERVARSAEP